MGSRASKPEDGGEVVPARIRPLLRRRFEDIKTRHASAIKHEKGPTLSKKQLLQDGGEEGDDDSHKSLDSPGSPPFPEPEMSRNEIVEENVVDTPRSAKVAPEPECDDKDKANKVMDNLIQQKLLSVLGLSFAQLVIRPSFSWMGALGIINRSTNFYLTNVGHSNPNRILRFL